MNLTFKYIIFAIFSTIINLLTQSISFYIYEGFLSLYVAMFFGTLSGLVVKYILD
ncbi:MAG: GtrA family protein, partial [Campylobacterales bacterium]|nr:GtrA family protein [Campylobacterales bacterium]